MYMKSKLFSSQAESSGFLPLLDIARHEPVTLNSEGTAEVSPPVYSTLPRLNNDKPATSMCHLLPTTQTSIAMGKDTLQYCSPDLLIGNDHDSTFQPSNER